MIQSDNDQTNANAAEREDAAAERQARLDALGSSLSRKRMEAVNARAQSGIEQEWLEDEEFYEGYDDANRHEQTQTLKPVNQVGAASAAPAMKVTNRSNVFLNIVRPYVDFSAGRAADMLMPTDDRAWQIKATPLPDLTEEQKAQILDPVNKTTFAQAVDILIEDAKKKADKAQARIEDWHVECQFHAELRKVIKDAAKVGVGILKGPFPIKRKSKKITRTPEGIKVEVHQETRPASKRISYWNFYPDPACGEDIHAGNYTWEKDRITARQLRNLKGTLDADKNPLYIETAIDACLAEGPQKKYANESDVNVGDHEQFEIWYFYGDATAEDLRAAGCDCDGNKVMPVIVTMVNDRVIKAALSPLDSGEFPYDVLPWQNRAGHWAGIGVGRQVRTPQRMINAGARNMMDNAGLAAGPQIIMKRDHVIPADGIMEIRPRKIWYVANNAEIKEVAHAFMAVPIPMMQQELLNIIQFAMKMAEDVTGLPMLLQGQQGTAPETVGGMTMLQNNSSTVLRMIAKTFDDMITEPHIRRYYEWLLIYGPEEDEKGDFIIDARGSSALFERDAANQAVLAMGQFILNPIFGKDPKKWINEAMKAQRLDPKRFDMDPKELEAMQKAMAEKPADPAIQVAEIRAKTDMEKAALAADTALKKMQMDTDRDTAYVAAEEQRTVATIQARQSELEMKLHLAQLDYANRHQITIEQLKVKLADTAMKLRTQKELAAMPPDGAPQVATPPTEPKGRAPDGQAYQR